MNKIKQILEILFGKLDLEELNKKLKNFEIENNKFNTRVNFLQHENENLKNEINILKGENFSLENSDKKREEEIGTKLETIEIKKLEVEIFKLEARNKKLYSEKKQLEEIYNKYKKIDAYLKNYELLIDRLKKCNSLEKLTKKIESKDHDKEILKFIGIFGNGEDFLRDVYIVFKEKKLSEKFPLTREEIEFIDYTNEFFNKNYNYDSDVFIKVNINQDRFDKSTMQDILKPSDYNFKIVEEFYVPGVKTKSYNFKAIVRGRK